MAGVLSRIGQVFRPKSIAAGGGYTLPISGGFIPYNWPWNFWQQGRDPLHAGESATVHACIDAYAQTIASLPINHFRVEDNGERVILQDSVPTTVLRYPNEYQTRSDYVLNLVKYLLFNGNAYTIAYRGARNEIRELHLVNSRTTAPHVEPETMTVFYGLGKNPMVGDLDVLIPARDVMHNRLYTPRHPLVGVSPITNLAASISANNAILNHQAIFFDNMSRPSGILSTDQNLNRDQIMQLRAVWEDQSRGLNSGGVPILANGLKWQGMSITSQDSQLVEAYKMGVHEIARAFRVPLPLIGDNEHSTYNNVEQLVNSWLSMGLGFVLEHLERSLERFFDLPSTEKINFDTDTMMRTDFAGRIDALTKGIQGGLYSPNEARRKEGLKEVEFGEEPRVQAQVVPLSQVSMSEAADSAPTPDDAAEEEEVPDEVQEQELLLIARKEVA